MTRFKGFALGVALTALVLGGLAYAQQTTFQQSGTAPTQHNAYDHGLLGNAWRDMYVSGHFINPTSTTPPVCGVSCGTVATILGNDSGFVITTSVTSLASPMIVTFGRAWGQIPACTAANQTTAANYVQRVLTSTTQVSIYTAAGPTAADKISVQCSGAGG